MDYITVNRKKINFLENDTEDTLRERIASEFNTLPTFFTSFDFPKIGEVVSIQFLLEEVAEHKNSSFESFLRRGILERYPKIDIETIIKYWLVHNEYLRKNEIEFLIPEEEFRKMGINIDIGIFYRDKEKDFLTELQKKIKQNKEKSKKFTKIFKKINAIVPFDFIDFQKEKSVLSIKTNIRNTDFSLPTVFHHLCCNNNVPFISFDGFYKMYKDLKVEMPADWSLTDKNFIISKIFNKDGKYTDCIITFIDGILYFNISVNYSETSGTVLKERLLSSIFIPNFVVVEEYEESLSGIAIFHRQSFNVYIMSDLIMNNEYVWPFMAVDESKKATKNKSGLYLHFFIENIEGTCSIISKKAEKTDQEIKNIDRKKLPLGENFIRLRVTKAKNIDVVNKFLKIFAKILNIYYETRKEIIDFFQKYVADFGTDEKKDEIQKIFSIRDIAPDLFVSGYSRRCPNPPKIIEDTEVEEYEEKGFQTMKFPATEQEGTQYNYVCESEQYAYIGLRVNNLKNRHLYRYVPCCYEKDQKSRKNSSYNMYFSGRDEEKGMQQNILVTNKLAPIDEFAVLPKNIDDLFYSMDNNFEYFRKGVHDTKISFFECVLEGALKDFSQLSKDERLSKLHQEYKKLLTLKNMCVASQENPDKTPEAMLEILRSREYMDPRQWIRLCEVIYDCRIFILSKDPNSKNGVLNTPNFYGNYLEYQYTPKTTIFIYEHMGNESDDTTYPHNELIIKWDKEKAGDSGMHYSFNGKIPLEFYKLRKKFMKQFYYNQLSKNIVQITDFSPISFAPISQIIDSNGKTRGLLTKEKILLLCDPIPPLNIPLLKNDAKPNTTVSVALDFINKYNFQIISQHTQNDIIKEIIVRKDNNRFIIQITGEKDEKIQDVKNITQTNYPLLGSDRFTKYNYYQRIANILVEYFTFMFSIFTMSDDEMSLRSIKKFIKTKIVIVKKNQYIVPTLPFFSIDFLQTNNFVDKDGKLIIDGIDTLRKLIYSLRLRIATNNLSVKDYHLKHEINNFYMDANHYILPTDTTTVIVRDDISLLFQNIDGNVYNKINTTKNKFFLKNQSINGGVPSLLVVGNSLDSAVTLSKKFFDDKRRTKIWLYFSSNNVEQQVLKRRGGNVLAYKKDGKIIYSALLPL
jgi:hypothetical protein